MKNVAWALALVLGVALAGCGGVEGDEELALDGLEEAVDEEIAWSELEQGLNSYETKVQGSWNGRSGAFRKLVLNGNKRFVGDRVVYCIRAPCPPVRVTGTWYASSEHLSLRENGVTTRYDYVRTATTLTLKEDGGHGLLVGRFSRSSTNACRAFRGTCRAVTASGCGTGRHAGDARDYPCGPAGTVGTMCCLPD